MVPIRMQISRVSANEKGNPALRLSDAGGILKVYSAPFGDTLTCCGRMGWRTAASLAGGLHGGRGTQIAGGPKRCKKMLDKEWFLNCLGPVV